ncbi:hypothetical protein [Aeromonas dhakensis]|uniref:hypothetical protein n=1 Tax=Aeromonas dhakensis TaxID=196024 RepID=UPI00300E36FB
MDLLWLFSLLALAASLYATRFWDRRHAHPECASGDTLSARCCGCGSDKVLGHPQIGWFDHRFRHTCLACGKVLFRTEEPR